MPELLDLPLLTDVGDLFKTVMVFTGAIAAIAFLAGRWVGRSEGADERAVLRLELRLASGEAPDQSPEFVDLAAKHGLLDPQEVTS